jgi:hypothetical protein
VIFVVPYCLFVSALILYDANRKAYWWLVAHEGLYRIKVLEVVQFLMFLSACIVGYATVTILAQIPGARTTRIVIWLFTLGCLFVALEEIAFGQQFFHFSTPETWRELNFQEQTTIHNLNIIQTTGVLHKSFIVVGLFGGISWIAKFFIEKFGTLDYLCVDWFISLYFIPTAIFYLYIDEVNGSLWIHQELFEFVLSMGFLLVAISNYLRAFNHSKLYKGSLYKNSNHQTVAARG